MGTPLTEEKFNEFLIVFEKRMSGVETRLSGLEKRMSALELLVKEIKGFQDHEAKAIEYELKKILQLYLKKKYQFSTVEHFGMKRINDHFGKEITELDAAFLIKPLELKRDYSRLLLVEKDIKIKKNKIVLDETDETYIFILAEAKHHITIEKVKYKLQQFHRICQLFLIARNVLENKVDRRAFSPSFIKTVERNPYFGKIGKQFLYFGAAYWNDGLLDTLQNVISEYKSLSAEFMNATKERKIVMYHRLCAIESEWYVIHNPVLTDMEIELLPNVDSIYNYIEFIVPSGNRFHIEDDGMNEIEGFPGGLRGGGGKTRKQSCVK